MQDPTPDARDDEQRLDKLETCVQSLSGDVNTLAAKVDGIDGKVDLLVDNMRAMSAVDTAERVASVEDAASRRAMRRKVTAEGVALVVAGVGLVEGLLHLTGC